MIHALSVIFLDMFRSRVKMCATALCAAITLKRLVLGSAISFFLALLSCPAYPQTSQASPQRCEDAEVLAIHGKWMAVQPGQPSRPLSNWSCVKIGEEIALQDSSSTGQITVIYLRGGKSPDTLKCPGDRCRNGYKVEAPAAEPNAPKSPDDQLLEFLNSIVETPKSKTPAKGILQGEARPVPVVTCSEGNKVSFNGLQDAFKPVQHLLVKSLRVESLNDAAKGVGWEMAGGGTIGLYKGKDWVKLIESGGKISYGSLVMESPLERPAFYEVEAKFNNSNQAERSAWVLITPETLCKPLTGSYSLAVRYTSKWPESTPTEAVDSFRLQYLLGLSMEPDKAPTATVPPK